MHSRQETRIVASMAKSERLTEWGSRVQRNKIEIADIEWTATEARRLAALLAASDVSWWMTEDVKISDECRRRLDAIGLLKAPHVGWTLREDNVVRHPYKGATPNGRNALWEVTPWDVRLMEERVEGLRYAGFSFGRDECGATPCAPRNEKVEKGRVIDALRLLNEIGVGGGLSGYSSGYSWQQCTDGTRITAICIAGKWAAFESEQALFKRFARMGRQQFKDRSLRSAAIDLLPDPGTDSALDAVLARHLAARVAASGVHPATSVLLSGGRPKRREDSLACLRELAALKAMVPRAEMKRAGRSLGKSLREWMGKSRRPGLQFGKQDAMKFALLEFAGWLPKATLNRAVKWCLYLDSLKPPSEPGRSDPPPKGLEPRWLDLFDDPALDARARVSIMNAAQWSMRDQPYVARPRTFAELAPWIRCAEISCWYYGREESADRLQAWLTAIEEQGPEREQIAARIEKLRPPRRENRPIPDFLRQDNEPNAKAA
jgi:hypothetical protein